MQQQPTHLLQRVPVFADPLNGYIHLGSRNHLSVRFKGRRKAASRIIVHELPPQLDCFTIGWLTQQWEQQLLQIIAGLHDIEADTVEKLRQLEISAEHHAELDQWQNQVELVDIGDWPEHRLFPNAALCRMQAVRVRVPLAAISVIGLYKGLVMDDTHHDHVQTAVADEEWTKYSFSFSVRRVPKATRVEQRDGPPADTFHVDAKFCLAGNPLANMLDYRVWTADRQEVDRVSGRHRINAALVPFSDNETGKVYVAVVALRDIQPGEELCIDYGAGYWDSQVALDVVRQRAHDEMRDMKQQLKQALDSNWEIQQQATEREAALQLLLQQAAEREAALGQKVKHLTRGNRGVALQGNYYVCSDAAAAGALEELQRLRQQDPPPRWDWFTCWQAARHGHLGVLQWVREQKPPCPWDIVSCCQAAATGGHLGILQWLRQQDLPHLLDDFRLTSYAAGAAARAGQLGVLQWLKQQGLSCPLDESICTDAAEGGQLEVLQWLRQQDPPTSWSELTCSAAARSGHLEVLQWLWRQGCPWDERTGLAASANGDLDMVEWLQQQGMDVPE